MWCRECCDRGRDTESGTVFSAGRLNSCESRQLPEFLRLLPQSRLACVLESEDACTGRRLLSSIWGPFNPPFVLDRPVPSTAAWTGGFGSAFMVSFQSVGAGACRAFSAWP